MVVHMFYPQDVEKSSNLLASPPLGTRRLYMKVRKILLIAGLLAAVAGAGSGATPAPRKPTGAAYGSNVIDLDGLRDIEFGDTEQELTRRGVLKHPDSPCVSSLTDLSAVSPVFDHERLVLLWADPPVHTPEGVTIGTS